MDGLVETPLLKSKGSTRNVGFVAKQIYRFGSTTDSDHQHSHIDFDFFSAIVKPKGWFYMVLKAHQMRCLKTESMTNIESSICINHQDGVDEWLAESFVQAGPGATCREGTSGPLLSQLRVWSNTFCRKKCEAMSAWRQVPLCGK